MTENDFSTPIQDKPLQFINKLQEAKRILDKPVFVFSAKGELRKKRAFFDPPETVKIKRKENLYILLNAKNFCVCVCIIKLLCHFLPDLAQILNKAMNSKGAASNLVPGADFTQLLILLRNYFYALLLERHMIDKCSCEATRYK